MEIDRYDYFFNKQGYIIKQKDESLTKKLKHKRQTHIGAANFNIDLPKLVADTEESKKESKTSRRMSR